MMKMLAFLLATALTPGNAFLQPLQPRDSVLVADQLRYGIELQDIEEGTPLGLPTFKLDKDVPLEILGEWQLDSVRVSRRKEKPARYDIRAFILLTAFAEVREGEIPLTFILVAVIYLGQQIWDGITVKDDISNLSHIIGGLVGGGAGWVLNFGKNKKI